MSEKPVNLQLIRTKRGDPIVVVESRKAWDMDGVLVWEKAATHIHCSDNEDPHRYDLQIALNSLEGGSNWLAGVPCGEKLAKKFRKLLKRARKL